ncbi:MAG: tRNA preQ1(34) S-adenosylmethionine ribosyltransferase-isomerase QueA [Treponema sp.]|nr:tRNA preQ1(34) S-adenosylmethionine ribosyltransferase-isomerase QueA [Spirochaetia bacterium]MDD7459618.1 tRNA preQ1(34) S-adenosylmethionine ribosyltransferase-isomerase QueA [Spirochaetales bacterium]MDY5811610.1 tRNA preQ1(34) S-adenosylmethionine ribosyltransferase-isomerase QueA [Treponema sp.]
MQTSDFNFELPEELIAQRPSGQRGNDKLMYLNKTTGQVEHYKMEDLVDLVAPGTLMVFNDSRVRRSRCYGIKTTSGREQEFMFLNPIGDGSSWNTMVKGAKKVKAGNEYKFTDGTTGVIKDVVEGSEFRTISFEKPIDEEWFNRNGHIPLPPYIRREDDDTDSERYQTVYAKETGSAAAPTAGLHFTETILQKLKDKGIELAWVTLHVGLGTFLPVREDNIEDHKMHTEFYTVSEETAAKVAKAKAEGRPVLAVGTTSVRTLESASDEKGNLIPGTRGTNIFMYPGYKFKVVDQMFTNFHTPESTLIMLVSAFAGKENIMAAYKKAVENKYRFFSYGDCMLIK